MKTWMLATASAAALGLAALTGPAMAQSDAPIGGSISST